MILLHKSVYNMEDYFKCMSCKYFHELKASEHTSVRVKCHPILYNERNSCLLYSGYFYRGVKQLCFKASS